MRFEYEPQQVPVSDGRAYVAGALVTLPDGRAATVIPPEGLDPSAWLGQAQGWLPVGREDARDWMQALAACATLGAAGASGHIGL